MAVTILDLLSEVVRLSAQLHAQTDAFVDHARLPHSKSASSVVKSEFKFTLPTHSNIFDLFSHGAPKSLAEELASIHCDRASDLAKEYTELYDQAHKEICHAGYSTSSTHLSRLSSRLQNKFRKTEETWKQQTLDYISSLAQVYTTSELHRYPLFNHGFTPYLEAFFKENRLPSRADKLFLSRRSGMSYNQINIWFQNRRRRSKTSRLSSDTKQQAKRHSIAAETAQGFNDRKGDIAEAEDGCLEKPDPRSRSSSFTTLVDACLDSFSNLPPPSAFPTVYPPRPEDYPFPCRRGDFTMPTPHWTRRPVHKVNQPEEIDLSSIIDSFARLDLQDKTHSENERGGECDVMAPFTTRPLPAPLPSLFLGEQQGSEEPFCLRSVPHQSAVHRPVHFKDPGASSSSPIDYSPFHKKMCLSHAVTPSKDAAQHVGAAQCREIFSERKTDVSACIIKEQTEDDSGSSTETPSSPESSAPSTPNAPIRSQLPLHVGPDLPKPVTDSLRRIPGDPLWFSMESFSLDQLIPRFDLDFAYPDVPDYEGLFDIRPKEANSD